MKHNTLRIGAILALLSIPILIAADLSHGGHDPANLQSELPLYAANLNWNTVHLAQFFGFLLAIGGLVILLDHIKAVSATPFATLGLLTAFVAASTYAANQAVDGVAIKYVADAYVNAAAADKMTALHVAEAIRHIEVGLSSLAAINLSLTLLMTGLAIIFSRVFTRWLGWAALVVGCGYMVGGLLFNYVGFAEHVFTFWIANLLLIWLLFMVGVLWRESNRLAQSLS